MNYKIALIRGDGIGPEVVSEAVGVLEAVGQRFGHCFTYEDVLLGGCATDAVGKSYPDGTAETCKSCDAVLLGAVGAPVFAGFSSGPAVLLGQTGGYILGFIGSALLMWGLEKLWGTGLKALGVSMFLGLLVCYAFGTAWFMFLYTKNTGPVGLWTVLGWCVIPYIIPDLVKIAVALGLTARLRRHVK